MGMAEAEAQFHVLAVDDSLIDRKLIERLLKTSSYQVTTVDSGSKALELLGWHHDNDDDINNDESCNPNQIDFPPNVYQELDVNLVITDYCMPGMSGYDLLKKMKESSFLRNIPVVIMSSENVPSRINRCLEEGAEEFFLKPVRLSDVNKLKPHMMKAAKGKDVQSSLKQESPLNKQEEPPEEQEQEHVPIQLVAPQLQELNLQSQQQQQASQTNNNSNSKRKPMDEGLSPDRTRPRYNGLTVMSS